MRHCELTYFAEFFAFTAFVISLVIMVRYDYKFGQNLAMLFGLSLLSGAIGIIYYRISKHKFPF